MADDRKLEKTRTPGIYRKHAASCERGKTCRCPYVVRWKARRRAHKQFFATYELAREHKAKVGSGMASRRPQSSKTVADYYESWLPNYRGRTARGLENSSRVEIETGFRLHILPMAVANVRLRDLGAPDVRDMLRDLEDGDRSPRTIGKAKAALSVMLACAVEDGDLAANPVGSVRYAPSKDAQRKHYKPPPKHLTAADINAILAAMPDQWPAFFLLLAQTGVRVSELLGLRWLNVHLGDDPHIVVAEQVYKGKRKEQLKTAASYAKVPISPGMASMLVELRRGAPTDAPVFPSSTGRALNYANVYNRVLRPALIAAGIAVKVGETEVRKRGGEVEKVPRWDYQRIGFHAFRHACGSLLQAHGKTAVQAQGWLRHSQLSTTLDIYTHTVDDGLGGADMWDEILPVPGAALGATGQPETDETLTPAEAENIRG